MTDVEEKDGLPVDETAEEQKTPAEQGETELEDAGAASLSRALKLSFFALKALMLVIVALFLLDCAQQIDEGRVGLVRRFGRYRTTDTEAVEILQPGLHFVWPEPIERLETVSLAKRELTLNRDFWPWLGNAPAGDAPPPKESFDPTQDGYNVTGDLNLVHTRWNIEYAVDPLHPEDYLLATVDPDPRREGEKGEYKPEDILRAVAWSVIVRHVSARSVDTVLTEGKDTLRNQIRADIEREMRDPARPDRFRGGLRVQAVNLVAAVPPGRVKTMFDNVAKARSAMTTAIDQARGDRERILREAEAEAGLLLSDAGVYKTRVVERTRADAERIRTILSENPNNPEGVQVALDKFRLNAVREELEKANLVVVQPGEKGVLLITPSQEELSAR